EGDVGYVHVLFRRRELELPGFHRPGHGLGERAPLVQVQPVVYPGYQDSPLLVRERRVIAVLLYGHRSPPSMSRAMRSPLRAPSNHWWTFLSFGFSVATVQSAISWSSCFIRSSISALSSSGDLGPVGSSGIRLCMNRAGTMA